MRGCEINKLENIAIGALILFLSALPSRAYGIGKDLRKILPGGFVFPAFADAINVNPSYLLHEKKRKALSLFYEPPDETTAPDQYDGTISFASTNGRLGYGASYSGSRNQAGDMTHNAALGFGMGTKQFSLGVAVEMLNIESSFTHNVNLSFRYGKGDIYYQLVVREINHDSRFQGGIGYNKGPATLEASLLAPQFSRLGADPFTGSVAVAVDAGQFGAGARTSVTGTALTFSYEISVYFRPAKSVYLLFRFQDPRRLGFGLTLSF